MQKPPNTCMPTSIYAIQDILLTPYLHSIVTDAAFPQNQNFSTNRSPSASQRNFSFFHSIPEDAAASKFKTPMESLLCLTSCHYITVSQSIKKPRTSERRNIRHTLKTKFKINETIKAKLTNNGPKILSKSLPLLSLIIFRRVICI